MMMSVPLSANSLYTDRWLTVFHGLLLQQRPIDPGCRT
jgi:hypothetical protein